MRRAGSPVHDSSWPSTAHRTPAACRHVATARATFWLGGSKAAARPPQYRTASSSERSWRGVEAVRRADGRAVRGEGHARLGLDRHVAAADEEGFGIGRFAGRPSGTCLLAAAAVGAGEAVEEILPTQVLE